MAKKVTAERLLKNMRADYRPDSWLAAADLLEEQGKAAEAAQLRRRAELTLKVARLIGKVHDPAAKKTRYHCRHLEGNLWLEFGGGAKRLFVTSFRDGEPGQPLQRFGFMSDLRRNLLADPAREDYLWKRAADVADGIIQAEVKRAEAQKAED